MFATFAEWNFSPSNNPIEVDIFSFPASSQPPQLDSRPTGVNFLQSVIVPPNDGSFAFPIHLNGDLIDGGECFLFQVEQYDVLLGAPEVFLRTTPEPRSSVMLSAGVAFVLLRAVALATVSGRRWRLSLG
jgi:hypothetical protein